MVRLRLWADIPVDKAASGLEVEIPLPAHVTRVHCEVDPPGAAALQVRVGLAGDGMACCCNTMVVATKCGAAGRHAALQMFLLYGCFFSER